METRYIILFLIYYIIGVLIFLKRLRSEHGATLGVLMIVMIVVWLVWPAVFIGAIIESKVWDVQVFNGNKYKDKE